MPPFFALQKVRSAFWFAEPDFCGAEAFAWLECGMRSGLFL